ncbi:MAG: DUF86 domain-containing protein [Propionibacteriaceae bacterium]|nr:DUF86 domain-containing protein [Propionibacteriaceae bacterium]
MGEFDVEVVTRRLTMMRKLLGELQQLPVSPERLVEDAIMRYAVERMLTLLVDLAVGINTHFAATLGATTPSTVRESFTVMADLDVLDRDLVHQLVRSVGMRNILIHQYTDVDLGMVAAAVEHACRDYLDYVTSVANHLKGAVPGRDART